MRVLVTGGSGYLGSFLIKSLGKDAVTLSRTCGMKCDITDFRKMKDCLKDFDSVCHLAAKISVTESFENPYETFRINALGTLNVLEAALQNGIKNFVFISTSRVYGQPDYLPIDEKHPTNPLSPYGLSKLIAENICKYYSESFDMNIAILRVFNLYGPGQKTDLVIPTIVSQMNKDFINLENLDNKRDFVYVDDVVNAIQKSIGRNDTINIGSGKSHSIGEIIETISKIIGKNIEVKLSGGKRKMEIKEEVADIKKARSILDWEPKVELEDGLKRILNN